MGDTNIIISSDLRFNRLWEGKKIDIAHLSYIHKNQLIWWMDEHMNSQRKSGVVHKTHEKKQSIEVEKMLYRSVPTAMGRTLNMY